MKDTSFVYHKDGEIKVVLIEESNKMGKDWQHVATLKTSTAIEYLYNNYPEVKKDLLEDFKNLNRK